MKRIAAILLATGALCADTQQEEFRKTLKRMDVFEVVSTAWNCGHLAGIEQTLRAMGETDALNDTKRIRQQSPEIDMACTQFEAELRAAKLIE